MARGVGSNTGRGNYPAARVPGRAAQVKEGVKSIKPIKHPNKHMTTTQYKKTLKKAESNE